MEKKSDTSSLVSPGAKGDQTGSVDTDQAACSDTNGHDTGPGSEGSGPRLSHIADQAEDLIALASEAILRFEMAAEERMPTGASATKDVAVSLGNILQFVITSDDEIAQTFVSVVVEMKDFMRLLFNLMQQCTVCK